MRKNFAPVLPFDDTLLLDPYAGNGRVAGASSKAATLAANRGALAWLYDQPKQDESRFKRFLKTRPRCERALRWCLREPLVKQQEESRQEKLETALALAQQGVGPQSTLVQLGQQRLNRLKANIEGGPKQGDLMTTTKSVPFEDGFREEVLANGDIVRVCDETGARVGEDGRELLDDVVGKAEGVVRNDIAEDVTVNMADLGEPQGGRPTGRDRSKTIGEPQGGRPIGRGRDRSKTT